MSAILVSAKNAKELQLIRQLLDKMNISNKVLTTTDKEDMGLSLLMNKVNRTKKVSRETIMKKLK